MDREKLIEAYALVERLCQLLANPEEEFEPWDAANTIRTGLFVRMNDKEVAKAEGNALILFNIYQQLEGKGIRQVCSNVLTS